MLLAVPPSSVCFHKASVANDKRIDDIDKPSADFTYQCRSRPVNPPRRDARGATDLVASPLSQAQPSSFMAHGAFQILVMWRILSPSNSMT